MKSLQTARSPRPEVEKPIGLTRDEVTFHLLATGLLSLARVFERGQALALPYPEQLQQGLNRLAASALRQGATPPQSVADFLEWCRRPLSQWPVQLVEEDGATNLLDGILPTDFCENWACAASDVEADLSEQRLLWAVLDACRSAEAPGTYVAFRKLIIEHPVLSEWELQDWKNSLALELLAEHVEGAYEPAPAACITRGQTVSCCPTCGNLLLQSAAEEPVCEEERCRREAMRGSQPRAPRELQAREGILWLKRGLRRFVAAPGRGELRLEAALRERGLEVELWPQFDAYDLRVRFPDGEAWAVDVKDWAVPRLLARRVSALPSPIPRTPPWTKAYFVFPEERRRERPGYMAAFKSHCTILSTALGAAFEMDFLRDVDGKIAEIKTEAAPHA